MTYANTWSNPDGLNVGFGTNVPERQTAGVVKTEGDIKMAKLHITWQSTFGSTGALITIPAGSAVKNVYFKTTTSWTGGTSLAFGDGSATGGWITSTNGALANLVTSNAILQADGTYAIATGTSATAPKVYESAGSIYVTKVGTMTAGEGDLYVEFA